MLQWMGGSRRKVNTSRKSVLQRQKQYFEQKRRQQQNLLMVASASCAGGLGINIEPIKEQRSLDILNLLELSRSALECGSTCLKGREDAEINVSAIPSEITTSQPTIFTDNVTSADSCRFEEARVPLDSQIEKSPKKVVGSDPDYKNSSSNGINCKPSHWKTMTEQKSELSVFDLLDDDGPNVTVEECPTLEDHIALSLEGLGKVGPETPLHSPHATRNPGYSPLLDDVRKTKESKNIDYLLEDFEAEMDTMMQDIKVAPLSTSTNFPYNKTEPSLGTAGDWVHYNDHAKRNGSSIRRGFFCDTENRHEDIWGASSGFLDDNFNNERKYDPLWKKKTFWMGTSSSDLSEKGFYRMSNYSFEDCLLTKKRSSETAVEGFDSIESPVSYSKHQSENEFDFFVTSEPRTHSRSNWNFNIQNLAAEDVRDNSSLPSEESCSSTAVRGEQIKHSPSRLVAEENRRKHSNAFASPEHKCSSKRRKCRSSNPSKQKPSHSPSSILQEELGAHNNWLLEERYASVDVNPGTTSFCQNLERKFAVSGSENRTRNPSCVLNTPELHNKASLSFDGFRNDEPVTDLPPRSFISDKFGFDESPVFSNAGFWNSSPNFHFKGKPPVVAGLNCESPSPDTSGQGSFSKDRETKVKLQEDSCRNFELGEENFMGDNGFSSRKKMEGDGSVSITHTQECEGTDVTNPKTAESLETTHSAANAEEITSSLKKPDKHEGKVNKRKNGDAEIPLQCKIADEEMEQSPPERRKLQNSECLNSSAQVMMFKNATFFSFSVFTRY